jgi:hypothetical protein
MGVETVPHAGARIRAAVAPARRDLAVTVVDLVVFSECYATSPNALRRSTLYFTVW